ncbi:MAG TPA: hypothetical protein VFX45_07285 [Solirubrobacterales bacterium]|nr:hypothetical protein [Solirubrobacterales bacterium]
MKSRFRPKLNYANVIATIALFVALGGAAVAAGLPKNSVGPNQLKRGAVTSAKLRKAAVTSGKLAPKSVVAGKLGPNSVTPGNIGNGAISTSKIATGAVIASTIKNGVITTNKLQNEAVTSAKLGKGSVTLSKLADDVAPLLGTLKSGQTLRGVFDLGGEASTDGGSFRSSVSFQFPLSNTPAVTVLQPGQTSANCAGLGNGSTTPAATGGNLCVYITKAENLNAGTPLTLENNNRLGFGLVAKANEKDKEAYAFGQWAVTAP